MIKRKLLEAPNIQPVDLSEVKKHLAVSHTGDDELIQTYLDAALEFVEFQTGRKLISQIWQLISDSWKEVETVLPFGNLQSVISVSYKDPDGVSQTISTDYYVASGIGTDEGQIVFLSGFSTPSLYEVEPIIVEFECGYPSVETVPDSLKAAIKLKVSELYEDADTENAVFALCSPLRIWSFA